LGDAPGNPKLGHVRFSPGSGRRSRYLAHLLGINSCRRDVAHFLVAETDGFQTTPNG
jgi:hypothetical protein